MTPGGGENPYDPPGAGLPDAKADAAARRDRLIASRLLEARERGGYTLGLFLRWNARRYVTRAFVFVGSLAALGTLAVVTGEDAVWTLFVVMLGFYAGVTVQDLLWIHAQHQFWDFSERVTDWREVRRLAGLGPDEPAA